MTESVKIQQEIPRAPAGAGTGGDSSAAAPRARELEDYGGGDAPPLPGHRDPLHRGGGLLGF